MSYGDETGNAKIESTFLGREDHGIMTFVLDLVGEGWGQGFGTYSMDTYNGEKRVPTLFGMAIIMGILDTLEVDSWEKLKGQIVRYKRKSGRIVAIGHIYKEKWFNINELHEEYKDK